MSQVVRPTLGEYMSAECFRYLRNGAEETAGRALIVAAGKQRGHSLADQLKGLDPQDMASITKSLAEIFGINGTRLCMVQEVAKTAKGYQIRITESACSFGLKTDSANCAYTLGVAIGVMEVITGHRLMGSESKCCAMGGDECHYDLELLD